MRERAASKRNVVFLVRRRLGFDRSFGRRCGGSRSGRRRSSAWTIGGRRTLAPAGIEELKILEHNPELAPFLVGLFVVPGLVTQPAFHENRTTLLQILRNDLRCPGEYV